MNKKIFEKSLFFGYILLAGIATLVDISVLVFLTSFLGVYYLFSAGISYICGMIVNYLLNKVYNFKNKSKKIAHQFVVFAFVALIGLGLNQFFIWAFVEYVGLNYLYAKIISIFLVLVWSFFGHKHLTFNLFK